MPHVLIVEDSPDELAWMAEVAAGEGWTVATAEALRAARVHLARQQPDVLLTDLQLPDGSGLQLVDDLERPGQTQVIVVTGQASVDSVVQALRAGASDYLLKPLEVPKLQELLRRRSQDGPAPRPPVPSPQQRREAGRFGRLLGASPAMQSLYDQLARVAPTSATVLLIGASGTGKELAAQTVHELSPRRHGPFLAVNCGAISPQLIESELFGHEKGSFTGADRQHVGFFERADGGTLLLDEVTEMPMELQVKLLRVLETGTFVRVGTTKPITTDVRVIGATNRRPDQAVAEGKLREDLYHRLNVFPIRLPTLRERGQDIELLARHFLAELNRQEGTRKTFSPQAIARLYARPWAGNVRELRNCVQRAYILADDVIDGFEAEAPEPPAESGPDVVCIRIGTPLAEVERRVTMATLERCGNVKRRAAEVLGISLKTLYNRLEAYATRDRRRPGGDPGRAPGAQAPGPPRG
ncbi:sigma-54-dependent Fis family transcriptional regulator [Caldimonas thermodepolymerans]|uniref:Sigma-54-dependent Fis family transcriptional regulator n=1 Tax=Caldimonas thermodepolymerans TaxID=215580 RepID=A0A2S5T4D0_9BURK|nr:sigma-54 dependent transcriptional regulator [Caldimonas thermodepolymerans]PPE69841.1 sigma-54-dependent Fis family transcriptional regulator [Caldimonas thermodepolymerans]QPC32674.1 sigma-54-dependent Fis family transcriptional regulator [Caldimonas thermodepolymerans]RDI03431.1 DNA-binding NtrC family response regulator [Caldimonas thermodepolymerans]